MFDPNNQAITGNPTAGASSSYGLNDVWASLQNALASNQAQNYATSAAQLGAAPQFSAAQGAAATGNAAQASAAQGGPASFLAALGNAAQGTGSYMQAAQGTAAQMPGATISTAGDAAWQARQQQLANTLQTQASGGGVSPADLQLRQGTDNNIAAQLAVLGSQRGGMGNPALTARAAADQGAAANAGLNSQMGVQRAQETLQAQQALGALAGQARGQSQAYNQAQAGLTQGAQQSNLGAAQQTMLANLGNLQGANQFNAGQGQGMTLADMQAINAITGANLGALNTANQGNAQLAQQSTLANQQAANAMTSQDLTAQNQFGLNNVNNAQAMNLANLANEQQQNLANQSTLAQYGLQQGAFNQQTGLANQQTNITSSEDYYKQMLGLLGAQTGIAQANQQAAFADQSLLQNAALTQYGIDKNVGIANSQANANLEGAGIGAGAALLGAMLMFSDRNLKTGIEGGNPMVQSFLEQYQAFRTGQSSTAPVVADRGLEAMRGSDSSRGPDALSAGVSKAGQSVADALKALAARNNAANIAASKSLGQASGASAYQAGLAAGPPPPDDTSALAPQNLQGLDFGENADTFAPPEVADDTSSDDNEKDAVMSGNRGLQAFLQQANAQQNAQNQQGAQNNAFMQTGGAPTAQVDRQLPDVNAGYGANASPPPWLAQAGIGNQGGYSLGQVLGGGYNMGGYNAGAGVYGGGITNGPSYASNEPDVLSSGGWMNSGQFDPADGMPTSGTVTLPNFMHSLTVNSANDPYANFTIPPFASQPQYSTANTTNATSGVGASNPASGNPSLGVVGGLQIAPSALANALATLHITGAPTAIGGNTPVSNPDLGVAGGLGSSSSGSSAPLTNVTFARSDERDKESAEPSPEETKDMLDRLTAYSYRYKDPDAPGAAPGRRLGVMAQDLERSPLGKSFVRDTPDGKMVDYGQAAGTMMAALAYHNERLDDQDAKLRELLQRSTAARAA